MKAKKGDKVKIVACVHGHEFEIGEIVTIMHKYRRGHYNAKNENGKSWYIEDEEFENANL